MNATDKPAVESSEDTDVTTPVQQTAPDVSTTDNQNNATSLNKTKSNDVFIYARCSYFIEQA